MASRGTVSVNEGARAALERAGRSLLAVGVTAATGDFAEGDAVEVLGPGGEVVAKGLARVGRDELDGYDDVVVHRDDLVLLRDPDAAVTLDG